MKPITNFKDPIKDTLVLLRTNLNGNGSIRWRPSVFLDLFHWPLGKNVCNCNGVCSGSTQINFCRIFHYQSTPNAGQPCSIQLCNPKTTTTTMPESWFASLVHGGYSSLYWKPSSAQPFHNGVKFFLKQHHRFSYNYYFQGSNFQFSSFCSCMFYLVSS